MESARRNRPGSLSRRGQHHSRRRHLLAARLRLNQPSKHPWWFPGHEQSAAEWCCPGAGTLALVVGQRRCFGEWGPGVELFQVCLAWLPAGLLLLGHHGLVAPSGTLA